MDIYPTRTLILVMLTLCFQLASAQYLSNPSFEGTPQPHVPPTGWAICTFGYSTPDTQPGNFGVYVPASHGNTYLGMTARDDYTWEDVHSVLITPLSVDSCYLFQIDLAFQEIVNGLTMLPITLKIYGHNTTCDKTDLLWQSSAISNEEWETSEFVISPEDNDITDIVLEAYYSGSTIYWGYILIDNIRISNEPKVDIGNDTTLILCEDGELTLNAGSGYSSYIWSTGSDESTTTVDSSGVYWVQVTNQYGCTASDTIDVTILEYQEMTVQMIDSTYVCEGQQVSIFVQVQNGIEPYSFYWQATGDTTASTTVIVDSTAFYVVEITDECGNLVKDSIKMIVSNGPELELGDDLLVCYGEEVELSAGSGFNAYLWQDGSTDSSFISTSPGWFWVTVSDFLGCTTTDSIFIEYYPEILIDLGEDTVMCEVIDVITLNAGPDWVSYLWYDGSTGETIEVTGPGVYWVTVEDVNGCFETDTIEINLSPAVLVTLGGDTTVCENDDYVLNPGAGFTSYLWQDGSTGPVFPVTYGGIYWVYVTDIYGCEGADTVEVTFNPSPVVSLGSDTVICTGTSLVLDPGSQYSSYLWQDNSTLPVYTVTNTGIYSVTVTNIFDCPATAEVFVDVTSPDIDLGQDTILCMGDSLFLNPGPGYEDYLWQDGSTGETFVAYSGGEYSVVVSDSYSCESEEIIVVTSLENPVADIGDDQVLCTGDSLLLSTVDGPYSFSWNGEPGGSDLVVITGGVYQLEVSNQCGNESDVITVTEIPPPDVDLGADQVLQQGESLQLNAGAGYDQYIWQDGTAGQYYEIFADGIKDGAAFYWVEVWDGPCKNSDTTWVEVFRVNLPNVITPNGDGINDTFSPMVDGWSGIERHHMEIFNRWGEKVWETDDFESGWDGKRDGNYVSEGTYFWLLDAYYGQENIKKTFKGTVTVLTGD